MNNFHQLIMFILESLLAGIGATLFMDLLAKAMAKRKLIFPFLTQEELGRWFLYTLKGKIAHKDIRKTPKLKKEIQGYFVSHYLIGIFLAGIYLFLANRIEGTHRAAWMALVFGISTIILPWFCLLPGVGLGIMAKKSENRVRILWTNLVNHTSFGIGLFLWMIFFHQLFMDN